MMSESQPGVGDIVFVKNTGVAGRRPTGLNEGDSAKLLRFDHGYWDREKDAEVFNIAFSNINHRIPASRFSTLQ